MTMIKKELKRTEKPVRTILPVDSQCSTRAAVPNYRCKICDYQSDTAAIREMGLARGNTERFLGTLFHLWKCPGCLSIHNIDPVNFSDIYSGYPLSKRKLDVFARGTMRNLLKRLKKEGLSKSNSILDYGCGNGIFVQFLKEHGYKSVTGYDPYVEAVSRLPEEQQFDCVIVNDVIEHAEDPRRMVGECTMLVKPGGILYIGTTDSEPVDMSNLEPELMRLHQPFHRIIFTFTSLIKLATESGLEILASYRRSYMDTLRPFSNYRFLDEFNRALGHNMDRAFDHDAGKIILKNPALLFYAFFGYFFPVAYEPAVVLRKPG